MNDYTTYFYIGNLDYRPIPKNASSSMRYLIKSLHQSVPVLSEKWTKEYEILQNMNDFKGPKRSHCISFAIKRNPVDRYISAYDDVIRYRNKEINNVHFQPQTFFAGKTQDYDYVFDTSEMNMVYELISEEIKQKISYTHIRKSYFEKTILSRDEELEIIKKYEIDYINGWH